MKIWETFTNQKQWEEYLKELLKTNRKALMKAAILIYDNQTEFEKENLESKEDNKKGFDKYDAGLLTRICRKLKAGKYISEDECYILRSRIPKYWKQLMIISKKQMEEKQNNKNIFLNNWENKIKRRFLNVT